eukprot:7873127-Prorocentrum_lima.AAC.1
MAALVCRRARSGPTRCVRAWAGPRSWFLASEKALLSCCKQVESSSISVARRTRSWLRLKELGPTTGPLVGRGSV